MKFSKLVAMGILMATMAGNVQGEVIENVNIAAEITGTFTTTTAEETKLREAASPTADIIKYLSKDVKVEVLEKYGDFYKVKTDGLQGYIYKTQLDTNGLEAIKESAVVKEPVKATSKGEEIVKLAKKYIGGKYVYGGNNLETGVDCSGFTQQIMKKNGITIERTSRGQYASNGVKVSLSNIKPGDLVFYGKNGVTVDHVAIYAGNNQIVHASDSKSGIKMSNLHYGKPIIGVKRVTN